MMVSHQVVPKYADTRRLLSHRHINRFIFRLFNNLNVSTASSSPRSAMSRVEYQITCSHLSSLEAQGSTYQVWIYCELSRHHPTVSPSRQQKQFRIASFCQESSYWYMLISRISLEFRLSLRLWRSCSSYADTLLYGTREVWKLCRMKSPLFLCMRCEGMDRPSTERLELHSRFRSVKVSSFSESV